MFTGLIEHVGRVVVSTAEGEGWRLEIESALAASDAGLGDSIAVDGVCLTVTAIDGPRLTFGLAPETRRLTTLAALAPGAPVNLERALAAGQRMGGHFVQGHIDGVGTIRSWEQEGDALWLTIAPPPELLKYIAMKGYIALDGASLTVARLTPDSFAVTLVAYTQDHVAFTAKPVGAGVNLEVDILAKYIERVIAPRLAPEAGETPAHA